MSLIDVLAERHIEEALEHGELEELPREGSPLSLADDSLVLEELRAGHRLLKNAGCLPPEMRYCGEVKDIETLLRHAEEPRDLLGRMHCLIERNATVRCGATVICRSMRIPASALANGSQAPATG